MKVWRDETEIVVAETAEDAARIVRETTEGECSAEDFRELPAGEKLKITFENANDIPARMLGFASATVDAPVSEWAKCEPGIIGSSEW